MADQELLEALLSGATSEDERRHEPRHTYQVRQRVAFPLADEMPPPNAFAEVQFRDLSMSGCSFWVRAEPTGGQVIIELGKHPRLIYMSGKIVYRTPTVLASRRMFLIGVHFLGRYGI